MGEQVYVFLSSASVEMLSQFHVQDTSFLLPFKEDAGWAPQLVWIFWRRENLILSP
jgi:hypothetical protein